MRKHRQNNESHEPYITSNKRLKDVVIDTSIFMQDPYRNRSAFKALEDLCKRGKVRLHIPRVVYEELTINMADSQSQQLGTVASALEKLSQLPTGVKDNVSKWRKTLNQKRQEIIEHPKKEFDTWCMEVNAQIHEIQNHHGQNVMKGYFLGAPPFKQIKSRNDIPDGFIYEAIKDIASVAEEVAVACHDDKLAKACEGIANVKTFRKLDDLITSPEFHSLVKDQEIEKQLSRIVEALEENEELLHEAVEENIVEALVGKSVEHHSIPSDENEASILSVDGPEQIEFDFGEAIYIGAGIVNIPFTCEVSAETYFCIYKADYYTLPRRRAKNISISEYDNDHYYEADETLDVEVHGTLAIEIDLSKMSKNVKPKGYFEQLIQDASIQIDSIDDLTLVEPEVGMDRDEDDEDDEDEKEDDDQNESDSSQTRED
jgi:hypothetical protein